MYHHPVQISRQCYDQDSCLQFARVLHFADQDSLASQAVLNGPRPHIFAAVTSSEAKAHGGEFLRRNMVRELQAQVGACRGDVLAAFK